MRRALSRTTAAIGIGVSQLRGQPVRTVLVTVGVALAVLAAMLLASVGMGVLATGEQQFESADRDLWVTGGPMELSPDGDTVVENSLHDSHSLADDIEGHDDVDTAAPISFEAVYVGADEDDLQLLTGVGITATHDGLDVQQGEDLSGDSPHYDGGTYEGEMTREVIVDPRTADLLGVDAGDTIFVGGSAEAASDQEFTVVGVAPDYGQLLGTPTVTLHLSELQSVTGAVGTDRASLIAVTVDDSSDPEAVQSELETTYPDHEIRTNREQLVSVLGDSAVVVASAVVLVVLAVLAGLALTANLLALSVTSQAETLAALQAVGLSRRTLLIILGTQGLLLGGLGWLVASALTAPAVSGIDQVAAAVVGYEDLLVVPNWLYGLGAIIGFVVGAGGAVVAGLLLTRLQTLQQLQR